MRKIDLLGQVFGRLTVIKPDVNHIRGGKNRTMWICKCKCGNVTSIRTDCLKQGTQSCGCLLNEMIAKVNYRHGEAKKTKEHRVYFAIKQRCYNPNCKKFPIYGARGIIVHENWLKCYENFLNDVGRAPSALHSLDRIDVNGNYEPGNVRWATAKEQANNTRKNVWIEYNGETKSMKQWAETYSIDYKKFHGLYRYKNLSLHDIITLHGKL